MPKKHFVFSASIFLCLKNNLPLTASGSTSSNICDTMAAKLQSKQRWPVSGGFNSETTSKITACLIAFAVRPAFGDRLACWSSSECILKLICETVLLHQLTGKEESGGLGPASGNDTFPGMLTWTPLPKGRS